MDDKESQGSATFSPWVMDLYIVTKRHGSWAIQCCTTGTNPHDSGGCTTVHGPHDSWIVQCCTMGVWSPWLTGLYNTLQPTLPMSDGLYNIVQQGHPPHGWWVVQHCTTGCPPHGWWVVQHCTTGCPPHGWWVVQRCTTGCPPHGWWVVQQAALPMGDALYNVVQQIALPMGHGLYSVVQQPTPSMGDGGVQCCTTVHPLHGWWGCTTLYNNLPPPQIMELYNIVQHPPSMGDGVVQHLPSPWAMVLYNIVQHSPSPWVMGLYKVIQNSLGPMGHGTYDYSRRICNLLVAGIQWLSWIGHVTVTDWPTICKPTTT